MQFRFDGVRFFLTYPQSGDLQWQDVISHLQRVKPIAWARICKEQHASGEPHLHVVGQFASRLKTSNCRIFDVAGKHPNVQPVRSVAAALKYVSKDGEFHDIGTVPESGDCPKFDIMAAAKTLDEPDYYAACLQHKVPFQYADKFLKLQKGKKGVTVTDEHVPDLTRETLELLCIPFVENKANVLIGPTGHGKTQWAKRVAPKPALWVRHIDLLNSFRIGFHKSIIFDEMVFTHYPRETQIQIADWQDEAHIHCRYTVAIIPAGIQRLFCANREVFIDDPAINRRCSKRYLIGPDPIQQ